MTLIDTSIIRKIAAILLLASPLVVGCGIRPQPLPEDVSIDRVLDAMRERSTEIKDFSGWAKVRMRGGGHAQSTTAILRYLSPARFTLALRGFAGTELATVGSDGDSITVYIPYYEGFIRTGKEENPLAILAPEANIDIDRLISIIRPSLPSADSLKHYSVSFHAGSHKAELIFARGNTERRFILGGPRMLPEEEIISVDGDIAWRARMSDYRVVNGIHFPGKVHTEQSDGQLDIAFYDVNINSGLTVENVTVYIPEGAQRLKIRGK